MHLIRTHQLALPCVHVMGGSGGHREGTGGRIFSPVWDHVQSMGLLKGYTLPLGEMEKGTLGCREGWHGERPTAAASR